LRKRGFSFVGPTIVYAHMQATGMVNDHAIDCYRRREIIAMTTESILGEGQNKAEQEGVKEPW